MSTKTEFSIEVTIREFQPPFRPSEKRYEVTVVAESEQQAVKEASGRFKTKGYPFDETRVRVLYARPLFDEEEARLQAILAKTDHLITMEERAV